MDRRVLFLFVFSQWNTKNWSDRTKRRSKFSEELFFFVLRLFRLFSFVRFSIFRLQRRRTYFIRLSLKIQVNSLRWCSLDGTPRIRTHDNSIYVSISCDLTGGDICSFKGSRLDHRRFTWNRAEKKKKEKHFIRIIDTISLWATKNNIFHLIFSSLCLVHKRIAMIKCFFPCFILQRIRKWSKFSFKSTFSHLILANKFSYSFDFIDSTLMHFSSCLCSI